MLISAKPRGHYSEVISHSLVLPVHFFQQLCCAVPHCHLQTGPGPLTQGETRPLLFSVFASFFFKYSFLLIHLLCPFPFFFPMCTETVITTDLISGGQPVHGGGGAICSRSFLQLFTERAEGGRPGC